MTGGWSADALALPVGQWLTAQVLRASSQSIYVMMIHRRATWATSVEAVWTEDGRRMEAEVPLSDIAAWRELTERDHVPSHLPRRQRLAVVPSTVTGAAPTECVNGHAQPQGSVQDPGRVGGPAPIPRRRGFAVVAAADPTQPGSGDERRVTEAGPTGGVAGDTSAAEPTALAAPGSGSSSTGSWRRDATSRPGGRPGITTCATTGAPVPSGGPDQNSEPARRTPGRPGGTPGVSRESPGRPSLDSSRGRDADEGAGGADPAGDAGSKPAFRAEVYNAAAALPRGPSQAEQEAADAAYAARARSKRFEPDVVPGRPDGRGLTFDEDGSTFYAPPHD